MAFQKPPHVFASVREEVAVKNNLTDAPPNDERGRDSWNRRITNTLPNLDYVVEKKLAEL